MREERYRLLVDEKLDLGFLKLLNPLKAEFVPEEFWGWPWACV